MANFIISPTSGTGNGTITVTASAINTTSASRVGSVKVATASQNKTIGLTQYYRPEFWYVTSFDDTTKITGQPTIPSTGGYVYVRVSSAYDFWFLTGTYILSNSDITDKFGGEYGDRDGTNPILGGTQIYRIYIHPNTSGSDLTVAVNLAFKRKDGRMSYNTSDQASYFRLYLKSSGSAVTRSLTVSPMTYNFTASGGTQTFNVTFNGRTSGELLTLVPSLPAEISVSTINWDSTTSSTGTFTVTAEVGGSQQRSGSIVVRTTDSSLAKTVSITQDEAQDYHILITGLRDTQGGTYTLPNPSLPFDGRTYVISLDNTDSIMDVSCDSFFVNITQPEATAQEIRFTLDANWDTPNRPFTITIQGNQADDVTLSATQEKYEIYLTIDEIFDDAGNSYTTYPADGRTYYAYYSTNDEPIEATPSVSWITIGDITSLYVEFYIAENTSTTDTRSGNIVFSTGAGVTQTVSFLQDKQDVEEKYITYTSFIDEGGTEMGLNNPTLPNYGGEFVLAFTTNDTPLTLTKSDDLWFSAELYSDDVTITVTPNSTTSQKSAWVTLTGASGYEATFNFKQAAADTTLTINPSSETVTYQGASGTISVTANTMWAPSTTYSWIELTSGTQTRYGNESFHYFVDENLTGAERTGTIKFTSDNGLVVRTFTITQETGEEPVAEWTFVTHRSSDGAVVESIPEEGGSYYVTIFKNGAQTSSQPTITATDNCTVTGTGGGNIVISVNSTDEERIVMVEMSIMNEIVTYDILQSTSSPEGQYIKLGMRFNESVGDFEIFTVDGNTYEKDIKITFDFYDIGTTTINSLIFILPAGESVVSEDIDSNIYNEMFFNDQQFYNTPVFDTAMEGVDIYFSKVASQDFCNTLRDDCVNTSYDNITWYEDVVN